MTTPLTATRAVFAFPAVPDPARHRDYNAWHQLDHQPENLALPGVLHGDRWVRSPDCRAAESAADPFLSTVDYLAMYWFAEPAERSVAAWRELGNTTLQQGRRPDLAYTERPLLGLFRPVRGYLADGVRISAAALPYRPHRGVYVTVTGLTDPASAEANERYAWHDEVAIPRLLATEGAVGCWTFRSEEVTSWTRRDLPWAAVRITLCYVATDPVEFAAAVPAPEWSTVERPLLAGPLRTITPWEWDWFDR